jgi:hypothetical protein
MARIRILQGIAGSDFSWRRGDLVDLPDDVAAAWADGDRAEYADPGDGGTPPPPNPDDQGQGQGQDDAFDAGAHTVADVVAYLGTANEAEVQRVLNAEQAGQARKTIASQGEQLLQQARERDAAATPGPAEVAADTSRGGGRGDLPETR